MGPGVCRPPGERPTISLPVATIVNRASIITTTTSRRRQRIVISLRLSHLRLHTYTQTDRQTPIAKRYRNAIFLVIVMSFGAMTLSLSLFVSSAKCRLAWKRATSFYTHPFVHIRSFVRYISKSVLHLRAKCDSPQFTHRAFNSTLSLSHSHVTLRFTSPLLLILPVSFLFLFFFCHRSGGMHMVEDARLGGGWWESSLDGILSLPP